MLVVVPSRVLMEQWSESLKQALPNCVIGRLGDSFSDRVDDCDVLVTTRHSASAKKPVPPDGQNGLIIADECHGFGGLTLRKSLIHEYDERLGLTATLERSDDAVEKTLLPYFGGVCFRYDFAQAILDGVCAQPRVAFVAVPLAKEERDEYDLTEADLVASRQVLRSIPDMPQEPFGAFLAAVSYLSENDAGPNGKAATTYLESFSKRREIVATSRAKYEVLSSFAPVILGASGALIFTQTVKAANHAINRLDPLLGIEIITGDTARLERETILTDLRKGKLDAVAAPRVLDEGIDVPNANLGIVVNASRTRRQMIQRMGRILRIKKAGVGARFVVLYASDTLEDPSAHERDGFMEEIESISESAESFGIGNIEKLVSFLDYHGPEEIIAPEKLGPLHSQDEMPSGLDEIEEYAWLSFIGWTEMTEAHREVWENPPKFGPSIDYLEIEVLDLPEIVKQKVSPKQEARLSTGDQPVAMQKIGKDFVLRCTGCGAMSEPTPFRWKALEAKVECDCLW